ncbi:MAG: peptide ABC transporter substrate-binding protein [Chloroflexi bacterium]|nr:peptide ABC transporter substrate-binding protein [Chloroflexota bacterium]
MPRTGAFARRRFLQMAGVTAVSSALAACGGSPPPAAPTAAPTAPAATATAAPTAPAAPATSAPAAGSPTAAATPAPAASPTGIVTPQGRTLPPDAAPLDQQVYYENATEPKHLDVVRDIYSAAAVLNWGGEPMLRLDENYQIVPALAESYSAGPNAEYFDFVLRKDARWSDGTPITPEDWVFTFRHAADPKLDNPWAFFYYAIKGVKAYKEGTGRAEDIGVVKIDDRTVRIYGDGPAPQIPALMTYQASVPAPRHRAEKDPLHWADTVDGYVSSGPFKLVKWIHNQRMEWEINPYYNGPHKPGVQRVVQLLGAGGGWFNAWLNKEIDLLPILQPAELTQVRANAQLKDLLHSFPDFETKYVSFDTFHPPFNNRKLRQALSHAVDRDTLCTKVLQGTNIPAYSMLPPGFPAYNAALRSIQTFDPEQARALLAEAGYPGGKDSHGTQLTLDLYAEGNDIKAQFLQEQWQSLLGIKVNVKPVEGTVWKKMRSAHQMPLFINRYEYDYIDPSNLLTSIWKSTSDKGSPTNSWKNDEFDRLVTAAGREQDAEKRISLYQQAERILVEDVGGIFLTHMLIFQVWWPYVTGIPADRNGNVAFHYLDISRFQMYMRRDVGQLRTPH